MSAVTSSRILKQLKEKLKRYGINIAEVVRGSLLGEVEKIEQNEIEKQLDILRDKLKDRIDPYGLTRIVEEDRERR